MSAAAAGNEPAWTPGQLGKIQAIYDELARLLPIQGRDYTIEFEFGPDDVVRPTLKGLNPMGVAWVQHCGEQLTKKWGAKDGDKPEGPVGPVSRKESVI